jgi:hypothetical protein
VQRLPEEIRFPNWSNPFIGVPTLVTAAIAGFGQTGEREVRRQLFSLGRYSAVHLLATKAVALNANAAEWAAFAARLFRNDGFADAEIAQGASRMRAAVAIRHDPHVAAYALLESPPQLVDVMSEWERGVISVVNPRLKVSFEDSSGGGASGVWRYEVSGAAARAELPEDTAAPIPLEHQAWVNGLVRMYAVITALIRGWGDDGESVVVEAYRRLGTLMIEEFVRRGIAKMGCSAHEWGAVSDEIAINNGLTSELIGDQTLAHTTKMPSCAGFAVPLRLMDAPAHICELPMNWDNAEMDVVNPTIMMKVPACTFRGDQCCVYSISPKNFDPVQALPAGLRTRTI